MGQGVTLAWCKVVVEESRVVECVAVVVVESLELWSWSPWSRGGVVDESLHVEGLAVEWGSFSERGETSVVS